MSMTARLASSAALFLASIVVIALMPAVSAAVTAGVNNGVATITLEELFPDAAFDPAMPTQAAVTGVDPGERPLRPDEILTFFHALAAASPRATLLEYGRTHEDRPLVFLAVSDEATIADLDEFKSAHAALLDPRGKKIPAAADLAETKAVAWLIAETLTAASGSSRLPNQRPSTICDPSWGPTATR